jgi:hypothetical protein
MLYTVFFFLFIFKISLILNIFLNLKPIFFFFKITHIIRIMRNFNFQQGHSL